MRLVREPMAEGKEPTRKLFSRSKLLRYTTRTSLKEREGVRRRKGKGKHRMQQTKTNAEGFLHQLGEASNERRDRASDIVVVQVQKPVAQKQG